MSDGVTNPHGEDSFAESKGKGKAVQDEVPHDTAMDEDDDEDESGGENEAEWDVDGAAEDGVSDEEEGSDEDE